MQDIQNLKQRVVKRLDLLPEPTLLEALPFVDFLIERSEQSDAQIHEGDDEALPAPMHLLNWPVPGFLNQAS
jgi:hypothetical protein